MTPLAVVKHLNILKYPRPRLLPALKDNTLHQFRLQSRKE